MAGVKLFNLEGRELRELSMELNTRNLQVCSYFFDIL